jgi:hypothetical protein
VAPLMTEFTDEDLLFDLELRVVPLEVTDDVTLASAVHTSYVSESCTRRCSYYTCRRSAAGDQNMCL